MKTLTYKTPCQKVAQRTPKIVPLINNGHRRNARKQVGNRQFLNSFVRHLSTTVLLLFALMVGSNLWAQDKPKWEVGTDLLWLVGKNTLPDYSIFARYKLSEENVLRLRVGTSVSEVKKSFPRLSDERGFMLRLG